MKYISLLFEFTKKNYDLRNASDFKREKII